VEFRVFGDVEILAAGQRVAAGHARQRSVLAVLLLDLGRLVPADQLIGRVCGENPPASVRNVLYGYVARLRAVLAAAGDPSVTLGRRPGGYLLDADPERVDLYRFRRLVTPGRPATTGRKPSPATPTSAPPKPIRSAGISPPAATTSTASRRVW
jgi:DNA-binding SARP family transcriptional activator